MFEKRMSKEYVPPGRARNKGKLWTAGQVNELKIALRQKFKERVKSKTK
jgi:hypothetical protein